ncbi:Disease resistance protein RRS1B [Cardamine amara subsp. amara]|uniref:Disease resistance protein RRS1B n=1 Tax=Cardamine amara subsp. amara TaxID=228776 RepID=A0ABD1AZV4_CARAN
MSSSSKVKPIHDVFIVSSCDDTRYSFVSHLSAALKRLNITVIEEDDKNLLPETKPYLPKKTRLAIERSKICVVILSENFAFSKHSLTTLVEVIEWRHGKAGTTVVPVFYGVDRSVVEQQIGKFGEAFAKHDTCEPKDRVTEWKNALMEAAHIKEGLISNNESSDLKLVEDIVSYVHERLFPTDKIGIKSRVLKIENLLSKQPWVVRSIGIWGMAGIGKTTIAKAAFDQMKGNYKSPHFIPNFEKEFEKEGMYRLREKHLPSNVKEKLDINRCITNQSQDKSHEESVFLVLDDVRNPINAESFLGGFEWFDPGSVIIITSRDKQVLVQCRMVEIYEVDGLDNVESLKLFSRCALGESQPEEGHLRVSNMVVEYANKNPKALSYYGKELKDKKPEEMEIAFLQLKLNPPAEILEVFKSSYDELSDDEKKIFLDVACFFKGDTVDRVMQILDGCGFFPCIGIDYLVEKSLVTICENRVEMHNLIQDVGKEILNKEVLVGMGRRLCDFKSIQPILEDEETKANGKYNESNKGTLDVEDIESILLEASCLSFIVDPKAFQDMCNLRMLKIYSSDPKNRPGLDFRKGLVSLPCELRLLHCENYSLRTLPEDFDPDNLVELNMPCSQLEELWEESKNLKSLKAISLHQSDKLVDIQELLDAHNLELIDLQGCTSLQSFPAIEHLYRLQVLNLCGCIGIKIFPEVPPKIKGTVSQGDEHK